MSATFRRTLRALEAEAPRVGTFTMVGGVLCLAWGAWLLAAEVPVYEATANARLEVAGAVHPITSDVDGRVVQTYLDLGQQVGEGQVVVLLDAEPERRALAEKRARRQALGERLTALRQEMHSEQQALQVQQQARGVAAAEARALAAEADARALLAERQAETTARLRRDNAASGDEVRRDEAEAAARRAAARALTLAAERQEHDRRAQESERQTRLARLQREAVELAGDAAVEDASIHRLEHEVQRRRLRTPISGRIGETAGIRPGAVVKAADRLAAVVPAGVPRAVAMFNATAVGRLQAGQPARLRLDGFPWAQYGSLEATVADVATEPAGGRVRVELVLAREQTARAPVEHGLTGSAEVEVERVAPVILLLRAAGQLAGP